MPKSDVLSPSMKATMASLIALGTFFAPSASFADEGGLSFWLPGLFGSLAAVPQQPGFALSSIYFHDDVHAGAGVSRAREISIGQLPATISASLSGNLHAYVDLNIMFANYAFATPVLGGQLAVTMLGIYGRESATVDANLSGSLATPLGSIAFARSDIINGSVTGFGDLYPMVSLRWNAGVKTRQLQVGVVGYVYDEVGCDSGFGDRVGCFQSRVVGIGPQLGYIIPLGALQAYVNMKGYGEFDAQNRPHGWNTWLTVSLAPAAPSPEPPSPMRRMYTK